MRIVILFYYLVSWRRGIVVGEHHLAPVPLNILSAVISAVISRRRPLAARPRRWAHDRQRPGAYQARKVIEYSLSQGARGMAERGSPPAAPLRAAGPRMAVSGARPRASCRRAFVSRAGALLRMLAEKHAFTLFIAAWRQYFCRRGGGMLWYCVSACKNIAKHLMPVNAGFNASAKWRGVRGLTCCPVSKVCARRPSRRSDRKISFARHRGNARHRSP